MSGRLRRRTGRLRGAAAELLEDAGAKVATAVTSSTRGTVKLAAGALVLGLVAGAALVWLGVSLGRQQT